MRVFLAHSSAQHRECEKIVAKLRSRGFSVFYSEDTIHASEAFDRRIREEIGRCSAMLFVVSPQSVAEGCYALTEVSMASERWPNPERRVLAVIAAPVELEQVPAYLRDNVELLKPRGDMATEAADAMVAIRRVQRRVMVGRIALAVLFALVVCASVTWKTRLAFAARQKAVVSGLLDAARRAPMYADTCIIKLESFSRYVHHTQVSQDGCDTQAAIDWLKLPALVVAQTGHGKKGFLQTLRGVLARRNQPAVLVSYRDCMRGKQRDAAIDLQACLSSRVQEEAKATAEDAAAWLADPSRYVVIFDGIDDSASRDHVFADLRALWEHQQRGGTVVLSSQPENLNYVLARYGFEEWAVWVRDKLPTIDVRGIDVNSVQRVASDYEEHRVPLKDVNAVLDFPQICPAAAAQIHEWVSQPKLFRQAGTNSIVPVARAIRALRGQCEDWRKTVLPQMVRARLWSYCHDELCNYETDGDKYVHAAYALRDKLVITEGELDALARQVGLRDADAAAFPLLSIGILYSEERQLKVDHEWIPEH